MLCVLLQCDWEEALKLINHAVDDLPHTEHRLLVFLSLKYYINYCSFLLFRIILFLSLMISLIYWHQFLYSVSICLSNFDPMVG